MSEQETLFNPSDFDDGRKKRKSPQRHTNKGAVMVPHEEPWLLMTNRSGHVGWHLPKVSNPYGSIICWCGYIGRPIYPRPPTMVVCVDCVAERDEN
jgi:hypothetical protein